MTQFSRNTKTDFLSHDASVPQPTEASQRNPLLSIWTHRWVVLIVMLLVSAVAVVHLYRAERIFQATARLTVERSGPRIVNNDPSEVMGQAQNFLNTQGEVLRSRKIFLAIAEDNNILAMKTFEGRTDAIVGYLKGNLTA